MHDNKWGQLGIVNNLSELNGKTIAIVGFGRIGERIAKIAKAFDMKVIVLRHNSPISKNPNVDDIYDQKSLFKLLDRADFVINCLPLSSGTRNFFDKSLFQKMKNTTYFINIGRGGTVVENDLIHSLKNGIIAGAGLDVFEEKPLSKYSELWELKNVIITPHYAGWSPKYIDRMIDICCDNLRAYNRNKLMPTLITHKDQF